MKSFRCFFFFEFAKLFVDLMGAFAPVRLRCSLFFFLPSAFHLLIKEQLKVLAAVMRFATRTTYEVASCSSFFFFYG